MTITWQPDKTNYPLMGKVVEDTGRFYRVEVTSGSKKSHNKLIGKEFMILKSEAQIVS